MNIPSGAQVLTLPVKNLRVDSGYLNTNYANKNKFRHFGHDYTDRSGKSFDVIASGNGKVIATGKDRGSLWHVAVIVYTKVYNPTTGKVADLTVRYFHMRNIKVYKGMNVTRGVVIGSVIGQADDPTNDYPNLHHVHVEIDKDTIFACYSPQVSGGIYIKRGINSTINPANVFVIGTGQTAVGHGVNTYYKATDISFKKA